MTECEAGASQASYASQALRRTSQSTSGLTSEDEAASHARQISGCPLTASCAACDRPLLQSNTTGLCRECRLIARNEQTDAAPEATA